MIILTTLEGGNTRQDILQLQIKFFEKFHHRLSTKNVVKQKKKKKIVLFMIVFKLILLFYILLEVPRNAFFTFPAQNIIEKFLKLSKIGLFEMF